MRTNSTRKQPTFCGLPLRRWHFVRAWLLRWTEWCLWSADEALVKNREKRRKSEPQQSGPGDRDTRESKPSSSESRSEQKQRAWSADRCRLETCEAGRGSSRAAGARDSDTRDTRAEKRRTGP